MKKNSTAMMVVVALLVGIIGFFAGMKYDQSQTVNRLAGAQGGANGAFQGGNFQGRNGGMMGQRSGMGNNRPISGQILSIDDKSMTVKLQDGSSKIVLLADTTTIAKSTTGTKADLKTGERVTAFGTTNADGSVTAQNVSLGDSFFRRGMMQSGTPTSTGTQ